MAVREISAKSLLIKQKRVESWFVSRYGMNIYRGCAHACAYCDGRAEKYRVDGVFGRDVDVKINAPELLERELDPARKRKPLPKGFIFLGGGVSDAYQPIEKERQLTRRILEIIERFEFPVHVLTKSTLVERDLDILERIHGKRRVIVSMSLSSASDEASRIFEPGCPSPTERLATLSRIKELGIPVGVYLMPVIPFLTDTPRRIDETFGAAKDAGVDFVVFSGMTLKPGRQKEHFLRVVEKVKPALVTKFERLYPGDQWGGAQGSYYSALQRSFLGISKKRGLPPRVPPELYHDVIEENDRVIVELENIDYLLKARGQQKTPYRWAAKSVHELGEPISTRRDRLRELSGVGAVTEKIILEILDRGWSSYYAKLLGLQ